jgi:hypothetical protein
MNGPTGKWKSASHRKERAGECGFGGSGIRSGRTAVGTFKRLFVNTGQLGVAHSDFAEAEAGAWSVARAVDLARRIEAALRC